MHAAAPQAGQHRGIATTLKEWWRGEIGTYNILRMPLEMRARDRTADGRRQRRANRSRGSETILNYLRSANKNNRASAFGWAAAAPNLWSPRPPLSLRGMRPLHPFRYQFEIMQDPQGTERPCAGAGSFDPAAWPLSPSNSGIVHFAKRSATFCNKT